MSGEKESLSPLRLQMVQFFADGVKVLGLPKSVGEIYGLLYGSEKPLALDDLVEELGISKGSASQGLKLLRSLGAVREVRAEGSRKTFYRADAELKSLVGGLIREQIRPHIDSAKEKVSGMRAEPDYRDAFLKERVEKLEAWRRRSKLVLPVIQKFLGE